MTPMPFSQKLKQLLEDSNRNQTWLADQSGIPASTVSRVLTGERHATRTVIESFAGVLGQDPWLMVQGTDAEARFAESAEWIRRNEFLAVMSKLGDYEAQLNERAEQLRTAQDSLAREVRRRRELEAELGTAHLARQHLEKDLEDIRALNKQQSVELRDHRKALSRAVTEITALRAQLSTLAQELGKTKQTARTAAILAGVAAFAGVVTATQYLRQDDDGEEDDDEHEDDEEN